MSRLPSSQRYKRHKERWKRYEKPQPGHSLQVDVKFIAPLAGSRQKHYQFTAIDDCTRVRVLKIYSRLNQKTAIQFIDYVLEKLPFGVKLIQTDNGAEFGTALHWHVLDKGVRHVYIRPATPRLNGKVERSHRIDADEFYRMLDGVVIDDAKVFNAKLLEWEHFLQFRASARSPGRPDSLRAATPVNPGPGVSGQCQLNTHVLPQDMGDACRETWRTGRREGDQRLRARRHGECPALFEPDHATNHQEQKQVDAYTEQGGELRLVEDEDPRQEQVHEHRSPKPAQGGQP